MMVYSAISRATKTQQMCAFAAAVYFSFLVSQLISNSVRRQSIFDVSGSAARGALSDSLLDIAVQTGSKLHLQDFHRVEVRNGRPVWEVSAKEAKYYAEQAVTHVNDASVVIYRPGNSTIRLSSKSARLYLQGKNIGKMHLEGDIRIVLDNGMTVAAGMAVYDASTAKVRAPGPVTISGKGYEIKGEGLDLNVDSQLVRLEREVGSSFDPQAEMGKVSSSLLN